MGVGLNRGIWRRFPWPFFSLLEDYGEGEEELESHRLLPYSRLLISAQKVLF